METEEDLRLAGGGDSTGFGLASRRWRWEAMGDYLELGYSLLVYSLEREIIRIEFFRVFSF